jgi:ribonuclease HII
MKSKSPYPTLDHEMRLWAAGYSLIAGIDEAGRGALAGPVVAAAVVLPANATYTGIWAAVKDSKLLSPVQRVQLAEIIRRQAAAWAVGRASAAEIDDLGIAPATRLAMYRAVSGLALRPDYLLLDWVRLPQVNISQESFTKGDRRIASIAAASILAKTARDALLIALHEEHSAYAFHQHKGYATAKHLNAIEEHGPCPEHRYSFAPLRQDHSLFGQVTPAGPLSLDATQLPQDQISAEQRPADVENQ